MNHTKDKILDTAERLIGQQGYAATSLRQIIAEAGVNLAAVHYHFGSKEELLDELVMRKASTVNVVRLARLEALEKASGSRLDVRPVLEAFFEPMVEVASAHPQFVRLMGRMYSEGMIPAIAEKHFRPTAQRYFKALGHCLPGISQAELLWRVHFMVGAMAHAMCNAPVMPKPDGADLKRRFQLLVSFLVAGFRAPATPGEVK